MLDAGRGLLDPVLEPLGYVYERTNSGAGSGGSYAVGRYTQAERAIELHCRYSLGIVRYLIGDDAVDHRDWVGFLGVRSAYPGYSDTAVGGFEHLAEDLAGVCAPLVRGECDQEFQACVARLGEDPGAFRPHGLP
jgi:hypothetical protein